MSAVGGIPSLSELLAWPTDHLTEAADHWETVGESSYAVVHQVWREATSVDWQGESADALHVATHADLTTTSAVVDQLQTAASVARSGASDLYAARSRVRYAVEDALAAGFEVYQDLWVTDRRAGGSGAQRAARAAEAQALAGDIRQRAARLVTLDAQVARKVTAAVSGIRDTFVPISPLQNDLVRAVDNHTVKQAPPMPSPPDPKDMTAAEARAAWAEVNREIADYPMRTHLHPAERTGSIRRLHRRQRPPCRTASPNPGPTWAIGDTRRRRRPIAPGDGGVAISAAHADRRIHRSWPGADRRLRWARSQRQCIAGRYRASDWAAAVCARSVRRQLHIRGQGRDSHP